MKLSRRRSLLTRIDWHVAAILTAALALRLAVWWTLPYRDWISDEAEYWGAATWLAQGRGFAFFDGWVWTRPPLYLIVLAAHARLFGPTALWAPRLSQALLSVVLVYLVLRLAHRLAPVGRERLVALLAGWAMALSYSFATFGYLLLSETLFITLLIAALLALLRWAALPVARLRWAWLALAGVLLGLSALTKALVLTWLPLVALWLLVRAGRGGTRDVGAWRGRAASALAAPALLTLTVCAIVLPWSAYATARWGGGAGMILVDTTGGYNFALGAQSGLPGGRDENQLHDQLCGGMQCDADQARRQQAAYALGWQWIAAEPAGFVRKTGRELLDMFQLQYGGAERLRAGYTAGEVPLPHLLGLLWDDTLYVVALLLAIGGLWRRQARPGKALVISWLLYNIVVGALVFAINRFRQPLLPFLFIYAGCELAQWRAAWPSRRARAAAWSLTTVLALLVLPSYLYWPRPLDPNRRSVVQDTLLGVQGLRNAAACGRIGAVLRAGDVAQARLLHDRLDQQVRRERPYLRLKGLDCLALLNARLLVAEGKIDGEGGALAFLQRAAPLATNWDQSARILMFEGDLLRRLGRSACGQAGACGRFVALQVETTNDLAWAWRELQPPPTELIDLGAGLDVGYIRGFYKRDGGPAEQPGNFRWSEAQATLRFPAAGTGRSQQLTLRTRGYTTLPQPTRVTVRVGGRALEPLVLPDAWQEQTITLPPTPAGQDVVIDLSSPVFTIGPQDLADRVRSNNRQPLRMVGFQLDWARLAGD